MDTNEPRVLACREDTSILLSDQQRVSFHFLWSDEAFVIQVGYLGFCADAPLRFGTAGRTMCVCLGAPFFMWFNEAPSRVWFTRLELWASQHGHTPLTLTLPGHPVLLPSLR
jgi:hypothetical protein